MFELLENDVVWKKVEVHTGDGEVIDGVYYPPTSTISYDDIEGIWEQFTTTGQESFSLPSGIGSTDAVLLFTNEQLKVAKDLPTGSSDYDILYIEDPTLSSSEPYKVQDKANWKKNGGFQLLDGHLEYLLIRVESL